MMMDYFYRFACWAFSMIICMSATAQQTSLTVDNQSPGWLSSKIAYGDQQTVENLKIVGYLNKDDLLFISRLMKENSLHGKLDLEEANFVSTTGENNNYLYNDYNIWGISSTTGNIPKLKLSYLSLPSTLEDGDKNAMGQLDLDTLFLNSNTEYAKALSATVRHLVIGENLTVLTYPAFTDIRNPVIDGIKIYTETVDFPSSLKEIREKYIPSSYYGIQCKIKNGKNLKYFPNLERLYASFFIDEMPDSIFLPKIKVLSLDQYYSYSGDKMFKAGMHVFIGKDIELITNMSHAENIHLHFSSATPPKMEGSDTYHHQLDNKSYFKLHVPKGSADSYRYCFKDGGTNVTIIEEEIVNPKYKLNYIIDGEVYKTYEIEFGSTITPEAEPTKEGYTFSGWSEIPETMPDHDVTVTGTFTQNQLKCATPTIQIENGQLNLSCETPGVTYVTSYTAEGVFNTKNGNEVVTSGPVVCHISVYATKKDYQNSDIATIDVELCVGKKGDVNQDGVVTITDAVSVVNIILNEDGTISAPAMESPEVVEPE